MAYTFAKQFRRDILLKFNLCMLMRNVADLCKKQCTFAKVTWLMLMPSCQSYLKWVTRKTGLTTTYLMVTWFLSISTTSPYLTHFCSHWSCYHAWIFTQCWSNRAHKLVSGRQEPLLQVHGFFLYSWCGVLRGSIMDSIQGSCQSLSTSAKKIVAPEIQLGLGCWWKSIKADQQLQACSTCQWKRSYLCWSWFWLQAQRMEGQLCLWPSVHVRNTCNGAFFLVFPLNLVPGNSIQNMTFIRVTTSALTTLISRLPELAWSLLES